MVLGGAGRLMVIIVYVCDKLERLSRRFYSDAEIRDVNRFFFEYLFKNGGVI